VIRLAVGDAPGGAVVALVLAGTLLGWRTGRTLATGGYRLDDEAARPQQQPAWWPAAALGLLWGFLAWRIGDLAGWAALPAYLCFAWLAVCLAWIDLDVHRLPDGLVLPGYPALVALLAVPTVTAGAWGRGVAAVACMAGLFAVFYAMAWVSPDAMGFGDVKLSGLIGLVMGWLSPWVAVTAVLAAFVVGGIVAVLLVVLRRVGLRGHIAYGPALLVGSFVALGLDFQMMTGAAGG
jgi:leader peptidase (prepilin peptidase)/N-methyltransferase